MLPTVKPGEWVTIGKHPFPKDAVVCSIKDNTILVVYMDTAKKRPIAEDAHWVPDRWEFVNEGVVGEYADIMANLESFVSILRDGRWKR